MQLLKALDAFFPPLAAAAPRQRIVVAFSGGPDSTALLWGLARLGRCELVAVIGRRGSIAVVGAGGPDLP